MFGGISHKLSMLRKKSVAGGGDVTPNAVNWSNIRFMEFYGTIPAWEYTDRQITGITSDIVLKIDTQGNNNYIGYKKNNTPNEASPDGVYFDPVMDFTITWIMDQDTITISNNQYLLFVVLDNTQNFTVTVINTSDSNTVLDTFTATYVPDVTPYAVNWNDVSTFPPPVVTNTQTISGISTPITLRIDLVENYDGLSLEYSKNNGAYQAISNGGTFTVSNADTLKFRVPSGITGAQIIFNVVNQSDSDAILDTISLLITLE